jgi:hypothetical protein
MLDFQVVEFVNMCLNNDALGFVFQSLKIGFAAKHIHYKINCSLCLLYFPFIRFAYNARNQIQTHMLIARVFTYSLLLLFVFACCVAFVVQLRNIV